MKYYMYLVLTFFTFVYSKTHKNNVCPTNRDYNFKQFNKKCWYNSDQYLTPQEIIEKYKYPCEKYEIITEDGYKLSLLRIPRGKNMQQDPSKIYQPVLCVHGIFVSSATLVTFGNKSMGFILADKEYDVWLLDSRGNTYSKEHIKYSTTDVRYWNFSYHEMGIYDLPAALDFIYNTTGRNDTIVIGMSMGTNILMAYGSSLPQHARQRVKLFVQLGPTVFLIKMKLPYTVLSPFYSENTIYKLTKTFGFGELFPKSQFPTKLMDLMCFNSEIQALICELLVMSTMGFDFKNSVPEIYPVLMGHFPAGSSVKTFTHLVQNYKSKRFCQFDYGHRHNKKIYNTTAPPDYNLSQVTIPGLIIYGANDHFSSKEGSLKLYNSLPKGKNIIYEIKDKHYTHLDFYYAKNVVTEVYDYMMQIMNNYKTTK